MGPIELCALGVSAQRAKKAEEARQHFDAALEIDPFHVQTLVRYGVFLMSEDRLEEAHALIQRAVLAEDDEMGIAARALKAVEARQGWKHSLGKMKVVSKFAARPSSPEQAKDKLQEAKVRLGEAYKAFKRSKSDDESGKARKDVVRAKSVVVYWQQQQAVQEQAQKEQQLADEAEGKRAREAREAEAGEEAVEQVATSQQAAAAAEAAIEDTANGVSLEDAAIEKIAEEAAAAEDPVVEDVTGKGAMLEQASGMVDSPVPVETNSDPASPSPPSSPSQSQSLVMVICPDCGTAGNKKFCKECGNSNPWFKGCCPECGKVGFKKFCADCGHKNTWFQQFKMANAFVKNAFAQAAQATVSDAGESAKINLQAHQGEGEQRREALETGCRTPATLDHLQAELQRIRQEARAAREFAEQAQQDHKHEVELLREQVRRSRHEVNTIRRAIATPPTVTLAVGPSRPITVEPVAEAPVRGLESRGSVMSRGSSSIPSTRPGSSLSAVPELIEQIVVEPLVVGEQQVVGSHLEQLLELIAMVEAELRRCELSVDVVVQGWASEFRQRELQQSRPHADSNEAQVLECGEALDREALDHGCVDAAGLGESWVAQVYQAQQDGERGNFAAADVEALHTQGRTYEQLSTAVDKWWIDTKLEQAERTNSTATCCSKGQIEHHLQMIVFIFSQLDCNGSGRLLREQISHMYRQAGNLSEELSDETYISMVALVGGDHEKGLNLFELGLMYLDDKAQSGLEQLGVNFSLGLHYGCLNYVEHDQVTTAMEQALEQGALEAKETWKQLVQSQQVAQERTIEWHSWVSLVAGSAQAQGLEITANYNQAQQQVMSWAYQAGFYAGSEHALSAEQVVALSQLFSHKSLLCARYSARLSAMMVNVRYELQNLGSHGTVAALSAELGSSMLEGLWERFANVFDKGSSLIGEAEAAIRNELTVSQQCLALLSVISHTCEPQAMEVCETLGFANDVSLICMLPLVDQGWRATLATFMMDWYLDNVGKQLGLDELQAATVRDVLSKHSAQGFHSKVALEKLLAELRQTLRSEPWFTVPDPELTDAEVAEEIVTARDTRQLLEQIQQICAAEREDKLATFMQIMGELTPTQQCKALALGEVELPQHCFAIHFSENQFAELAKRYKKLVLVSLRWTAAMEKLHRDLLTTGAHHDVPDKQVQVWLMHLQQQNKEAVQELENARQSLMLALTPRQRAQALLAVTSKHCSWQICKDLGLAVDIETQCTTPSLWISLTDSGNTGSEMQAWWVNKCCKKLGMSPHDTSEILALLKIYRQKLMSCDSRICTLRHELDEYIGGSGHGNSVTDTQDHVNLILHRLETICTEACSQETHTLAAISAFVSPRQQVLATAVAIHAQTKSVDESFEQVFATFANETYLELLPLQQQQLCLHVQMIEQVFVEFEAHKLAFSADLSRRVQVGIDDEIKSSTACFRQKEQVTAREIDSLWCCVRACLTPGQQAWGLVAAMKELGNDDLLANCTTSGLHFVTQSSQLVPSLWLSGGAASNCKEAHEWWITKCCASLNVADDVHVSIQMAVTEHSNRQLQKVESLRQQLVMLDQLLIPPKPDAIVSALNAIAEIVAQLRAYDQQLLAAIGQKLTCQQQATELLLALELHAQSGFALQPAIVIFDKSQLLNVNSHVAQMCAGFNVIRHRAHAIAQPLLDAIKSKRGLSNSVLHAGRSCLDMTCEFYSFLQDASSSLGDTSVSCSQFFSPKQRAQLTLLMADQSSRSGLLATCIGLGLTTHLTMLEAVPTVWLARDGKHCTGRQMRQWWFDKCCVELQLSIKQQKSMLEALAQHEKLEEQQTAKVEALLDELHGILILSAKECDAALDAPLSAVEQICSSMRQKETELFVHLHRECMDLPQQCRSICLGLFPSAWTVCPFDEDEERQVSRTDLELSTIQLDVISNSYSELRNLFYAFKAKTTVHMLQPDLVPEDEVERLDKFKQCLMSVAMAHDKLRSEIRKQLNVYQRAKMTVMMADESPQSDLFAICTTVGLANYLSPLEAVPTVWLTQHSTGRQMRQWWFEKCSHELGLSQKQQVEMNEEMIYHEDLEQQTRGELEALVDELREGLARQDDEQELVLGGIINAIDNICGGMYQRQAELIIGMHQCMQPTQQCQSVALGLQRDRDTSTVSGFLQMSTASWVPLPPLNALQPANHCTLVGTLQIKDAGVDPPRSEAAMCLEYMHRKKTKWESPLSQAYQILESSRSCSTADQKRVKKAMLSISELTKVVQAEQEEALVICSPEYNPAAEINAMLVLSLSAADHMHQVPVDRDTAIASTHKAYQFAASMLNDSLKRRVIERRLGAATIHDCADILRLVPQLVGSVISSKFSQSFYNFEAKQASLLCELVQDVGMELTQLQDPELSQASIVSEAKLVRLRYFLSKVLERLPSGQSAGAAQMWFFLLKPVLLTDYGRKLTQDMLGPAMLAQTISVFSVLQKALAEERPFDWKADSKHFSSKNCSDDQHNVVEAEDKEFFEMINAQADHFVKMVENLAAELIATPGDCSQFWSELLQAHKTAMSSTIGPLSFVKTPRLDSDLELSDVAQLAKAQAQAVEAGLFLDLLQGLPDLVPGLDWQAIAEACSIDSAARLQLTQLLSTVSHEVQGATASDAVDETGPAGDRLFYCNVLVAKAKAMHGMAVMALATEQLAEHLEQHIGADSKQYFGVLRMLARMLGIDLPVMIQLPEPNPGDMTARSVAAVEDALEQVFAQAVDSCSESDESEEVLDLSDVLGGMGEPIEAVEDVGVMLDDVDVGDAVAEIEEVGDLEDVMGADIDISVIQEEEELCDVADLMSMDALEEVDETVNYVAMLTDDQRSRIVNVFSGIDDDGGGSLEIEEVQDIDKDGKMFGMLNPNEDGSVTAPVFLSFFGMLRQEHPVMYEGILEHLEKYVRQKMIKKDQENAVKSLSKEQHNRVTTCFEGLDDDGGGFLEFDELQEIDTTGKLFSMLGATEDSKVTVETFYVLFGFLTRDKGEETFEAVLGHLEKYVHRKQMLAERGACAQYLSTVERARITQVHNDIDDDGGGTLEFDELKEIDEDGRLLAAMGAGGDAGVTVDLLLAFFGVLKRDNKEEVMDGLIKHMEKHAIKKQKEAAEKALLEQQQTLAKHLPKTFYEDVKEVYDDMNQDGTVSRDEMMKDKLDKTWNNLDLTDQGHVTDWSFVAFFGSLCKERGEVIADSLLRHLKKHLKTRRANYEGRMKKQWDREADVLSLEQSQFCTKLHSILDEHGTGTVDKRLLLEVDKKGKLFKKVDANHAGQVCLDAFLAFFGKVFAEKGIEHIDLLLKNLEVYISNQAHGRVIAWEKQHAVAWESATAVLNAAQIAQVKKLFTSLEPDDIGLVEKSELVKMDRMEVFDMLEANTEGKFTACALCAFFGSLVIINGAECGIFEDVYKMVHKYVKAKKEARRKKYEAVLRPAWVEAAKVLSDVHLARLRALHRSLDQDGSSTIEWDELKAVDKNGKMFERLLSQGCDGCICLDAFIAFFGDKLRMHGVEKIENHMYHLEQYVVRRGKMFKALGPEQRIRVESAFRTIDNDDNGAIEAAEIARIEGSDAVFDLLQVDNEGYITAEALVTFFGQMQCNQGDKAVEAVLQVVEHYAEVELRFKREMESRRLADVGTSREEGISDEERKFRLKKEAGEELQHFLGELCVVRVALKNKQHDRAAQLLENEMDLLDAHALQDVLSDTLFIRDCKVGEALFLQDLVRSVVSSPGGHQVVEQLGRGSSQAKRDLARIVACLPILGEQVPDHLSSVRKPLETLDDLDCSIRTGADKEGYSALMTKLDFQQKEASDVIELYEGLLGTVFENAAHENEKQKKAKIILSAFGVDTGAKVKEVSDEELSLHKDDTAAIEEWLTIEDTCRAQHEAESARSEAYLYEQLMQVALRNRPIMDFIFSKVQEHMGATDAELEEYMLVLSKMPSALCDCNTYFDMNSVRATIPPADLPPTVTEAEAGFRNAAEESESYAQWMFEEREARAFAELQMDNALALIRLQEQILAREYHRLCADAEGRVDPQVESVLQEVRDSVSRPASAQHEREVPASSEGLALDDPSLACSVQEISLMIAQGDDAGVVQMSAIKEGIEATRDEPHSFAEGDDPEWYRKTNENGTVKIKTPRKWDRKELLPGSTDFNNTHLGKAFWQNSPLEYVKSVRRTGSARGRHAPTAIPMANIPNPERAIPTVYQHDYNVRGMPTAAGHQLETVARQIGEPAPLGHRTHSIREKWAPPSGEVSGDPVAPGHMVGASPLETQHLRSWTPEYAVSDYSHMQPDGVRQAWPDHIAQIRSEEALLRPAWDPRLPKTPPASVGATHPSPTPLERHNAMTSMLKQKGKSGSTLKVRQAIMDKINNEVQSRMTSLMSSVGYGHEGGHLTHHVQQGGAAMMDDNMTEVMRNQKWLNDAQGCDDVKLAQQRFGPQTAAQDLLPQPIERGVGPTSAPILLPSMNSVTEGALTGNTGENVEFCLERWNAIGTMVDEITAKSRHLQRFDLKMDASRNKSSMT